MKSSVAFTFFIVLLPLLAFAQNAQDVCAIVEGASLVAQDDENTFLGKITNQYVSDSIFNEYGSYGSEYSSTSIWNKYGTFGSEYSTYSPHNRYTSTPPMIIKGNKIVGYLSVNKSIESSVSPNLLKALCYE